MNYSSRYLSDAETGKMFKCGNETAQRLLKSPDRYKEVSAKEYDDFLDHSSEMCAIGDSMKRVYGNVTKPIFDQFAARCTAEGVDLGSAFSELIYQYACGAQLTHVKRHAKSTAADYLGAKRS